MLDALLPFVHPGGVPPFSGDPGFEFVRGDVRDAQTVDDALRGVSVVCHLAAMVGLGVDFDDAPLVRRLQRPGDRGAAGRDGAAPGSAGWCWPPRWSSTARAPTRAPGTGLAATPPPRQATDLDAGRFEPRCERCGEPLSPELVPEEAPLGPRNVYAATKVAQEHLAGAWARATRGPGGGAALPQRLRPGDAARHALRRSGVVLPVRPGGAAARRGSLRTGPSDGTSSTSGT